MAFFDELSKRMNGVAQTAQKTAEIARLQRQVNQKQEEFDGLFAEIGKLYYSCHKRGVQPDDTMDALCGKIDSLAAEIEGLKLKLDDLKQIRRCPSCGSVQNNTSRFCANCGNKLEIYEAPRKEPEEQPEETPEQAESAGDITKNVFIDWPDPEENAGEEAKPEKPAEEE